MNEPSVEYGLLIKGVSYDKIRIAHSPWNPDHLDPDSVKIHGMDVETRPHDPGYLFISFGELGEDMRKETPRARKIRDWFARHVPEARVKWGIIHTER